MTTPERKLCIHCEKSPVETMVLPCEHSVFCHECSEKKRGKRPESLAWTCVMCFDRIIILLDEKLSDGQKKNPQEKSSDHQEEQQNCIICEENPVEVIVGPCNHALICQKCSDTMRGKRQPAVANTCIYCRGHIESVKKLNPTTNTTNSTIPTTTTTTTTTMNPSSSRTDPADERLCPRCGLLNLEEKRETYGCITGSGVSMSWKECTNASCNYKSSVETEYF